MLPIITFTLDILPIIILQAGLILGAPWGKLAMGGQFGDVFSVKLRIGAAIQLVIILLTLLIVLIRGELLLPSLFNLSKWAIWLVVALYLISAILNTITSSKAERLLGVPTTITLFISSLVLALS